MAGDGADRVVTVEVEEKFSRQNSVTGWIWNISKKR